MGEKVIVFRQKLVVLGKKWLYLGKLVLFGQKLFYLSKRWLYLGKIRSIWEKVVLFGQKVVAFSQKWLYLGKFVVLVRQIRAKLYDNCSVCAKSTKFGTMIAYVILINIGYGPHRNLSHNSN